MRLFVSDSIVPVLTKLALLIVVATIGTGIADMGFASAKEVGAKLEGMAAPTEILAKCANAKGDGAIIQAALDTGKPVHIVGPCNLDSSVQFKNPGQMIHGDGRTNTVMTISTILPRGAFVFATGDPGPIISDIGFMFLQPDTAARTGLINYTPAIYAENTPRFKLARIRITDAMIGIDASGNSSAAVIDDLEESAFSIGIWIDGSEDTIRIHNWHFFPFVITPNQRKIWDAPLCVYPATTCTPQSTDGAGGPVGLYSGRMDDLEMSDSLFLSGQAVIFFEGKSGGTFGSITNTAFDTYSGIAEFSGQVTIASSYFSLADNKHQALYVVGGLLQCSSCRFLSVNDFDGLAVVDQTGGNVILSNTFMQGGSADPIFVRVDGDGTLSISSLQFYSTLPAPKNPKFCFGCHSGGVLVLASGITPDSHSAIVSGVMMNVGFDGYLRLIGNNLNTGWRNICPSTTNHAVYANNGSAKISSCN
jgi:hypothetical protein